MSSKKQLYRIKEGRIIGGVCTGLAEYWDLDVTLIRLIFVLLSIFWFLGIVIYLTLWIVAPLKETAEKKSCPSCQREVLAEFVWCPYCGKSIKPVCTQCSTPLEPGWDHCPKCGAPAPGREQ